MKSRCFFCGQSLAVAELKQHCVSAHPDCKTVVCKEVPCGWVFPGDTELKNHYAEVHGYSRCAHCRKVFQYRNKLKAHLRNFHCAREEAVKECKDCETAIAKQCEDYEHGKPRFSTDTFHQVLQWLVTPAKFSHPQELKTEPKRAQCRPPEPVRTKPAYRHKNGFVVVEVHKCVFLECPETFTSKDDLLFHIKTLH